jgi:CDP-diacylglycerol--glycerol-3-phosphate 3-phosphatidyltransferase
MTIATWLTFGRLVAAPVFVLLLMRETRGSLFAACAIFVLAALTDAVDGWLARRTSTISSIGRWLDPIADKILIGGAYVSFWVLGVPSMRAWMVAVILGRELLVSWLRHRAERRGVVIHSSKLGKWKTGFQMGVALAILALMSHRAWLEPFPSAWTNPARGAMRTALDAALFFTIALTLLSGLDYLVKNRGVLARGPANPGGTT